MYDRKEQIKEVLIEDEMRESFMDFAMSVIISRAIPDVRDGLKPVQRRIIYAMHESGLTYNRQHRKSARVVGDVMGKYHPHTDSAIYDTLARMAQDFSLRYPLIDGQGNFGSIDGDPPGAQRYTEARMARLAGELVRDIDKQTVDFMPNYDGLETEPRVLPSNMPSMLINGSSGIAVGMATNIPPHNLNEVVDALCLLIDDPDASVDDLMKLVRGPDFPTGGTICGLGGIRKAYRTGRGHLRVRARAAVETVKRGGERERIVITEIPYQVNKTRLIEEIAALVRNKKVPGISDLRDESDKDGMRIVIELRRGETAQVILNQLYKHTQMQTTFGVIMLALCDGQPRVLSLRDALLHYINHRREVVTRRTEFDLGRAKERAHVLEGLKIALDHIDAIIKTIRASSTGDEARAALMDKFELSRIQAQAILDMRLQRLTGLERQKIEEEYLEVIKLIARLEGILDSPTQLMGIIKDELTEVKERFGDGRRTDIVAETGDMEIEDLIAEEEMVITISHSGYIKRLPVSTYRQQRRGGRGITGAGTKTEDFIEHLFIASTHDYILFFTEDGRVHWLKVHELPQAGRTSRGTPIVNLLKIEAGTTVTAFVPVKSFEEEKHLLMVTQRGVVKKTALSAYSHPRAGGIIALSLDEGDQLIDVKLTSGDDDVLLATRKGQAIRFEEKDARSMGRTARGVKGVNLAKGDEVIGVEVGAEEATVLSVTENGFGKRTEFEDYPLQHRGGKGVINIKASERNGDVMGTKTVTDRDGLMIITTGGIIIRVAISDIRVISRNTQGVRLIRLDEGDTVGGVATIAAGEDEEVEVSEVAEEGEGEGEGGGE